MRRRDNGTLLAILAILVIFCGGALLMFLVINLLGYGDIASPSEKVKFKNIIYDENQVCILEKNTWGVTYTNTKSMDPVLDAGMKGVERKVNFPDELRVGDIISYYRGQRVAHRIKKIGYDKDGWYAYVQGDTNPLPDPGKVRFNEVRGVLIAIIY